MNEQQHSDNQNTQQTEPNYHGDIKISGNASMPSGSEEPNSKRDQQFVSAQEMIESSEADTDESDDQPNIQPSETDGEQFSNTGDPGRTPGKAEGEDDSSAEQHQHDQDVENYEQTKEKKIAESVSSSN